MNELLNDVLKKFKTKTSRNKYCFLNFFMKCCKLRKAKLNDREKKILTSYFFKNKKLKEISEEFNISNTRVREIKMNAFRKMYRIMRKDDFKAIKNKKLQELLKNNELLYDILHDKNLKICEILKEKG